MNDDKKLNHKITKINNDNRVNVKKQIIYKFTASEESDSY